PPAGPGPPPGPGGAADRAVLREGVVSARGAGRGLTGEPAARPVAAAPAVAARTTPRGVLPQDAVAQRQADRVGEAAAVQDRTGADVDAAALAVAAVGPGAARPADSPVAAEGRAGDRGDGRRDRVGLTGVLEAAAEGEAAAQAAA